MPLFSSAPTCLGLDLGTSSLKLVELVRRRRTIELSTYAQADMPNLLLSDSVADDVVQRTATVVAQALERSGAASDRVVAALPSSVVFSTVLTLPDIPDEAMENAVRFAARDVVPAELNEMVLGWSRVADEVHAVPATGVSAARESTPAPVQPAAAHQPAVPVFVTAAPVSVVRRYTALAEALKLELVALEVETFPLVRSLLHAARDSTFIVDIGDRVTTFHIIEAGTARVSHTVEFGGHAITAALQAAGLTETEAEAAKFQYGVQARAPGNIHAAVVQATQKLLEQAKRLKDLYQAKAGKKVERAILIGGGANLRGLLELWSAEVGQKVTIGNPWKGLSYRPQLESRLLELGPHFAVAVGLAEHGVPTV